MLELLGCLRPSQVSGGFLVTGANCWNGKIDCLCLRCLKNMADIKPLCQNDLIVTLVLYTTTLTLKKKSQLELQIHCQKWPFVFAKKYITKT